jgi:hypothetical protein
VSAANMCVFGFDKRGHSHGDNESSDQGKVRELRGCVGRSAVAVVISITQQRRKSVKQEIDSWHELGVEECRQAVERAFGNLARKAWRRKESDKHVCSQG